MTKLDLRELTELWPDLEDTIRASCVTCADMRSRIIWRDGEPVVEPCPVCAAGDEGE